MIERRWFYTVAKSPAEIVIEDNGDERKKFVIKKYGWNEARFRSRIDKSSVYFIDINPPACVNVSIEEVPQEFLKMDDDIDMYETSENFKTEGQFFSSELAFRASKRLFTWDTYVYRLPHSQWLPAREIPLMREILEKYLPLKGGDSGSAAGTVVKCERCVPLDGGSYGLADYWIEVSPVDAGFASWHDAERICGEFSHNGVGGWRLPTAEELKRYAVALRGRLRERENVLQTTETILHWSSDCKNDTATAVVTQENEDEYLPLYHYPMGGASGGYFKSKNGPWRADEIERPKTDWLAIRPVRETVNR